MQPTSLDTRFHGAETRFRGPVVHFLFWVDTQLRLRSPGDTRARQLRRLRGSPPRTRSALHRARS